MLPTFAQKPPFVMIFFHDTSVKIPFYLPIIVVYHNISLL